jgi:hypothetical protein
MIKSSAGVPESDEYYGELKAKEKAGSQLVQEQAILKQLAKDMGKDDAFIYSKADKYIDKVAKNDEIVYRSIGVTKIAMGAEGVVASGAGIVASGPAAPVTVTLLTGTAALSADYAAEGAKQAFGDYSSKEGQRVKDSFKGDVLSYGQEKARDLALETALYAGGKVVSKAAPIVLEKGAKLARQAKESTKELAGSNSYFKELLEPAKPAFAGVGEVKQTKLKTDNLIVKPLDVGRQVESKKALETSQGSGTSIAQKTQATRDRTLNIREGEDHKLKIKGKAQITNNKVDGEAHAFTSNRIALEAAKDPAVEKVYMHTEWKTILKDIGYDDTAIAKLGKEANLRRRPDVVIYKDGKLNSVEVQSTWDDKKTLYNRNQEIINKLPKEIQGDTEIIHIKGKTDYKR